MNNELKIFFGGTSLVNGNCIEVMNQIPDKSIDMILCDLPYGVTQNKKDIIIPFDKIWKHMKEL